MRVSVILAVVIALSNGDTALSHPHFSHVIRTTIDSEEKVSVTLSKIKRKSTDAFYGNISTKVERHEKDLSHLARLASKSGDGFIADLRLARQDVINRLTTK